MLAIVDKELVDRSASNEVIITSIDSDRVLFYNFYVKWTKTAGALGGTTKLQQTTDGTNWTDIATKTQAINDGNGSVVFDNPTEFTGKKIRLHTTINAGGTCDLYAYAFCKGI